MFSPRQFFSKYNSPVTLFKRADITVEPIPDLPTPPDTPVNDEPLQIPISLQTKTKCFFQRSQSSRSLYSLPTRKGDRLDKTFDVPCRQPSSPRSPFSSVSHMKEPFHLVLPNSPPLSRSTSRKSSTMSNASRSPKSGSRSHQAAVEPDQYGRPTLLPSPTFSKMSDHAADTLEVAQSGVVTDMPFSVSEEYYTLTPSPPAQPTCTKANLATAMHDAEVAYEHVSPPTYSSFKGESKIFREAGRPRLSGKPSTIDQATFYSASPNRSIRQRSSSRTQSVLSSEGDWLAGTLSQAEALLVESSDESTIPQKSVAFKANQRKCQIVQHPPNSLASNYEHNSRRNKSHIGYATVVSTNNLRLITISRTSSTVRRRTSSSSSTSKHVSPTRPMTPENLLNEISAFSPETPLGGINDSGYSSQDTEEGSFSAASPSQPRFKSGSLASTLGSPPRSHPTSDDVISPSNVIASYCRPRSDSFSADQYPSVLWPSTPPGLHYPPPVEVQKCDQNVASRCDDYSWVLDQITPWIDDFPDVMLQLETPVITNILHHRVRDRSRAIGKHSYLRFPIADDKSTSMEASSDKSKSCLATLCKIFPYTSDSVVSALGATMIAQRYLISFAQVDQPRSGSLSFQDLESIPAKARSTLGIQCCKVMSNQRREKVLKRNAGNNAEILDRIVDKLLLTICGRVDEFMKRMLESIVELMMR